MADRYWVGGTASWDATAGTKWSLTSGGAGGEAVPTASDNVFFDAASGAVTVTVAASSVCNNINFTGFTGTFAGSSALAVSGSFTLGAGMTWSATMTITFDGSGTHTIDSNGITINNSVTFSGTGSWTLQDDWNIMNAATNRTMTLTSGTFDANNFNVTLGLFSSSNTNIRTLTMGSGTWTVKGSTGTIWNQNTSTNMTLNVGTSTVNVTNAGASARTFSYGSHTVSFYDVNITAGTGNFTFGGNAAAGGRNLNFTGYTGELQSGSGWNLTGNLTFDPGMTTTGGSNTISMIGTSGTQTVDTKGITMNRAFTVNAPGATVQLLSNLALNTASGGNFTLTAGTFDANDFNVTAVTVNISNSNTRTLSMGNGTWTIAGTSIVWNAGTVTNLTLNAEGSTILINDASATGKTFTGGGRTYNNIRFSGAGTGTFTISGSNTFNNFTVDTPPHTVIFTAGTTQTINGTWSVSGTAGNLITLQSTTTTNFNLSKSSGTVISDYLSIADSSAAGGASWYAGSHSTDAGGGNTGWLFTDPPVLPSVQTLTFSLPASTVVVSSSVSPTVVSASFSLPTVTIGLGATAAATVVSATFTLPSGTQTFDYVVTATVVSAAFSLPSSSVVSGIIMEPGVLVLTFTLLTPLVSFTGVKHAASWTAVSKSSDPSYTKGSKASTNWTAGTKSANPTYSAASKNSSTWTAQAK